MKLFGLRAALQGYRVGLDITSLPSILPPTSLVPLPVLWLSSILLAVTNFTSCAYRCVHTTVHVLLTHFVVTSN